MSVLNRNSIVGKMFMGLCCVGILTLLVAAARPFEPQSAMAANPLTIIPTTELATAAK